jgi:hypothetical protein
MMVSFLPALPLGMAAERDCMELKASRLLEPQETVRALNAAAPEGLGFLDIEAVVDGAPSLSRAVDALVYALALQGPGMEEAVASACSRQGIEDGPAAARLDALVRIFFRARGAGFPIRIDVRPSPLTLVLTIPQLPEKTPRPQDVVRELLGLENPVYDMSRLEVVFKSPGRPA